MTDRGNRRQYSDAAFIQAVERLEPASTPEVAEYVGCVEETARLRLNDLRDSGDLQHKKISHGSVWYTES